MVTIVLSKSGNNLNHGIRNESGGYGGTSDNRWSYKRGKLYELDRIPVGVEYQVEVNGVITESGTKE